MEPRLGSVSITLPLKQHQNHPAQERTSCNITVLHAFGMLKILWTSYVTSELMGEKRQTSSGPENGMGTAVKQIKLEDELITV